MADAEAALIRGEVHEALDIWNTLAKQDHAEAQVRLGVICADGQYVPQDYQQAAHWFRRAADQGNANGQVYLGHCFYEGQGVERDDVRAMVMFNLAAEQGHEQAIQFRDQGMKVFSKQDLDHVEGLLEKERIKIHSLSSKVPVRRPEGISGVMYRVGFPEIQDRQHGRPYFLVDSEHDARVLVQDFSGMDRLDYQGETNDGFANGQGQAILSRGNHDDYPQKWKGFFRGGVYLGKKSFTFPIHVLPEGDFLIDISPETVDPGTIWLYEGLSALGPLELGTKSLPQLYCMVPEEFSVLDEEAVKSQMFQAARSLKNVCPALKGCEVDLLPVNYRLIKGRHSYRSGFEAVLASATIAFMENGKLDLRSYDNPQAKEAKEQARQNQRQQARDRGERLGASRGWFDVRGVRLWMTVEEVQSALGEDIANWSPALDTKRMDPFAVHTATVRLTDGATFELSFTSTVTESIVFSLAYRQELRNGPKMEELIDSLEKKYGEPDEVEKRKTVYRGKYYLRSKVTPNKAYGPLGALGGVTVRAYSQTGMSETLTIGFNDLSLENHDASRALQAKQEAQRRQWIQNRSDKIKF
ncbi:MAG: sel1 repeat family protein [Nitrospirota bacterium]|nr:sel1 repeat family protein [Nitrospirota bacterium]MDH5584993.1 sel1 repeat family protein [Nitrospirota bacterium]MDH5774520.1 sel1 repeat family protein [Nitrospirota bacterium]